MLVTRYLVWQITDPELEASTISFATGSWDTAEDAEAYIAVVAPNGPSNLYYNVISAEKWVEA